MERSIAGAAALVLLLINSLVDIRYMKIHLPFTLAAGAAGAAACILLREDGLAGILVSLLPGLLLMLLALPARGGIGMGDGIVLTAAGFFWTAEEAWSAALLGFFLAGIFAGGMFLRRRRGQERFAFVPFLLLADILIIMTGG